VIRWLLIIMCLFAQVHADDKVNNPADSQTEEVGFTFGPPVQTAAWERPPVVRICRGAPVSETRVIKAVNYWKKLGYNFSYVIDDNSILGCARKPNWGEITISLIDNTFIEPNLAMTRVYKNTETQTIKAATIYIKSDSATKERVLEHEIGHALGWKHHRKKYHIMHPEWQHGGHDATGLKVKN